MDIIEFCRKANANSKMKTYICKFAKLNFSNISEVLNFVYFIDVIPKFADPNPDLSKNSN